MIAFAHGSPVRGACVGALALALTLATGTSLLAGSVEEGSLRHLREAYDRDEGVFRLVLILSPL